MNSGQKKLTIILSSVAILLIIICIILFTVKDSHDKEQNKSSKTHSALNISTNNNDNLPPNNESTNPQNTVLNASHNINDNFSCSLNIDQQNLILISNDNSESKFIIDRRFIKFAMNKGSSTNLWLHPFMKLKITPVIAPSALNQMYLRNDSQSVSIDSSSNPENLLKEDLEYIQKRRPDLLAITTLNNDYNLCSSYSQYIILPKSVTSDEIRETAKFRHKQRFPIASYANEKCILVRTAQPLVGALKRSLNLLLENMSNLVTNW